MPDVPVYIDSMLIDMEMDGDLVSIEMEVASGDPLVSQMEAGDYWGELEAVEAFRFTVGTSIRTITLEVKRNV